MFGFKRKKENTNFELVIAERQNYIAILTGLSQLLNNASNYGQAQIVEKLIELIQHENVELFAKLINGIDMWGGPGAVWDVYIEDKTANDKFQKEIIQLIDLMEKTGILGKGIKPIREAFIKWK